VRRPGDRLRSIARRLVRPVTMERLIDPVLADLQCEHHEAIRCGWRWRSRWIRLRGYAAFWRAIGLHAVERSLQSRKGVALTVTATALLLAALWVFDLMRAHMLPLPPIAPTRDISFITAPVPPQSPGR
jgi:hypothetical protein